MEIELILRVVETLIQCAILVVAVVALSTWKREMRGRDTFHSAKGLLEYVQGLRFLIYSKTGSLHQIYLNDIVRDRESFYREQLSFVGDEKVLFDETVWGVFNHLNIRSDFFIGKEIRDILMDLFPASGKIVQEAKDTVTYIHVDGFARPLETDVTQGIYEIHTRNSLTIKEYFERWERLIAKLQKLT